VPKADEGALDACINGPVREQARDAIEHVSSDRVACIDAPLIRLRHLLPPQKARGEKALDGRVWRAATQRRRIDSSNDKNAKHSLVANLVIALFIVVVFSATRASAQSNAVVYNADFQSYAPQAIATGWIDTSAGGTKVHLDHLFKTWPDPLAASNVVYGVKPPGGEPRTGRFSTYAGVTFTAHGHFEYRGRFLRTSSSGAMGVTFFAAMPDALAAYVIGLRQQALGAETMQLFAIGGGAPAGIVDSHFTPDGKQWTNFLIQADDIDGATTIRARFWPQGTPEPATFSIDAKDASSSRLSSGHIGVWEGGNGDAYVDDLIASSAAAAQPASTITFLDARSHATDAGSAVMRLSSVAVLVVLDTSVTATVSATSLSKIVPSANDAAFAFNVTTGGF
jgi:hypothetical protein